MLEIYLPVANMVVDAFGIILLGIFVGSISGFFGIGGNFIMIPLLNVVFGIPMNVAIGSSLTQIVAMSSSGTLAHQKMGNIDFKLAFFLLIGSLSGVSLGAILLNLLKELPEFDMMIKQIYIFILILIALIMIIETILSFAKNKKRWNNFHLRIRSVEFLKIKFPTSGISVSLIFPIMVGFVVGVIVGLTGLSGGFIMTPLLIYILGIKTTTAIGTDLFQMVFMSSMGSILHAVSGNVDAYLVLLMLIGSSAGAQLGARATRMVSAQDIRVLLSLLILVVAIGLAINMCIMCDIID
ncbi:MAG: sulfite exporter TauE/SafE family protein [Candidatus Altiarchaeales archaeon]|nr:MAG: sulfite exporter TauE/SafE family protein [Candidatus Altiarchaeales archaeon]RLI94117.1 MAG: sulfite exporter TauE/SafE family protein [Candidatus Altiarchaeales archaeon]RLI95388.1 MAG: sulfite exporter TauE/SafE family protein [Candidatus Altiarchaeales archaeon]HDO82395.1 sulfite exporter TauE/SafE family protein [Candidatus Altiarchaeales archaeon]HEX55044.1 sulfite exporter TauE/SafE family protein [Candidatus Altiarchaeales archaeon]